MVMKNSIFWDTAPSSPLKFNQRFGGNEEYAMQKISFKQITSTGSLYPED
jgi:hypothetical protein